jgi:hypothetical protein
LNIKPFFVFKSTAYNEDKINDRPNTQPTQRNEHYNARADLAYVEPMDPE